MPRADGLTPSARRMLSVLRERGDWVNRADLASALHYNELSYYHVRPLRRMADKGLIEIRRYRTVDYRLEHQYRVPQ